MIYEWDKRNLDVDNANRSYQKDWTRGLTNTYEEILKVLGASAALVWSCELKYTIICWIWSVVNNQIKEVFFIAIVTRVKLFTKFFSAKFVLSMLTFHFWA